MSSKREREYARRRNAEWQARRQRKAEQRRTVLRGALVAGVAVLAIAVVVGVWWAARPGTDDTSPAAGTTDGTTDTGHEGRTVPDPALAQDRTWTSEVTTSRGTVGLELFGDVAPQSVASFVALAQEGFFDGVSCHRLTTSGIYVLQCGDPTGTGSGGPGYQWGPVENDPPDDTYPAGTLAMARVGNDANSQGSQFFIVYEDSRIPSDQAGGYSVFGRVTEGLEVVEEVAAGGLADNGVAPKLPITIEGVTVQ